MPTLKAAPDASLRRQPLYRQVELHLRAQIESGQLQPGDLLPSVRVLCEQFGGINHLTVRQAIRNLAEDKLVEPKQGKGTYVARARTRIPGHRGGWETSRAERSLKAARSNGFARTGASSIGVALQSIALVLPNLEDSMFLDIARGVQSVLDEAGARTLILDSRGSWSTELQNIRQLRELPLSGAIIFPLAHRDITEQIFKMKLSRFPFVLVDRFFEDIETTSVTANNYQGGYDLTQALVARGRKDFVWIGELFSSSTRQRMQGFRDALNDCGIACPRNSLHSMSISPAASHGDYLSSLRRGIAEYLDNVLPLFHRPTLVFDNDQSALMALRELQRRGLKVPDDVAVAGFDDRPEAARSTPALTTVRQPIERMGTDAASALLALVSVPDAMTKQICLPVEIVLRESA